MYSFREINIFMENGEFFLKNKDNIEFLRDEILRCMPQRYCFIMLIKSHRKQASLSMLLHSIKNNWAWVDASSESLTLFLVWWEQLGSPRWLVLITKLVQRGLLCLLGHTSAPSLWQLFSQIHKTKAKPGSRLLRSGYFSCWFGIGNETQSLGNAR